ncbi:hypothetical protein ACLMJK_004124 [Lecanora helva]
MNGSQEPHVNPISPYYNVNTPGSNHSAPHNGEKRKSQDNNNTPESNPHGQTRAKRNRYISIACNECKRRKIKCNGNTPCQRCGNLSLDCVYATNGAGPDFKDSDEYRSMNAHINALQDQVNHLYASLEALRNGQPFPVPPNHSQDPYPIHPALAQPDPYRNVLPPSQAQETHRRFQGPTSSTFGFNVARSSLQTMGITAPDGQEGRYSDEDIPSNTSPNQKRAPMAPMTIHPNKDPLWKISKEEAIRLCHVYEEEMGLMYPLINIKEVLALVDSLFNFTESAVKSGLMNPYKSGPDSLGNSDIWILKMVLASSLIVEGEGQNDLARELYESCREAFEAKMLGAVDIKGLILLTLVAEINFQQDEETYAYRILGFTSRQCLEIGLHRRHTLIEAFPNEEERSWAIKLFWSLYVLDRRWSFGTGMPFALQDADIDPKLPEPDNSSPYLTAMIKYSRISSQVWQATTNFEGPNSEINTDNIKALDYQILQWHNSIPQSLRFHPDSFMDMRVTDRGQRRLQVILYFRTNQMRVLIYRPVLMSATSIMENGKYAQTAVDVAKDTIRVLTRLNETSDIYRKQQQTFNYFLTSALAVLFLAVAHAPVEFSRQVRDEFYMALDLIKRFSVKSYTSKRLWKAIKGLKEIGPKLGVVSRQALPNPADPHSSAAVAMAGLAGHQVDERAAFPQYQEVNTAGSSPMDGQQITQELTNLFEKAGGYSNNLFANTSAQGFDGVNSLVTPKIEMPSGPESFCGVYGNDGQLSKIMGNLF